MLFLLPMQTKILELQTSKTAMAGGYSGLRFLAVLMPLSLVHPEVILHLIELVVLISLHQ